MSDNINTSQKRNESINIKFTPEAINKIQTLINEEKEPEIQFLRIGVDGGGCSGLSYQLQLTTEVGENDHKFNIDGLSVVIDSSSIPYISSIVVDYSNKMLGGGFKFTNPLAKRSCSCGTSFSV